MFRHPPALWRLHRKYKNRVGNVLKISLLAFFFISIIAMSSLYGLSRRWKRLASRGSRVLLTGGGTGGHVNPALAIAEGIRNREPETKFLYVGVKGKAESVIVRRAGYPLRFVLSQGFPGLRPSPSTLLFLLKVSAGVFQSLILLLWFSPRWVVATGGYVSAPVIVAALILKNLRIGHTRIFLHEQNSIPGQLNALLGRWVDRVLLTFSQTLSFFPKNGVLVGYPIRGSITRKPREEAQKNLPFQVPEDRQVVFAFGGSQGARTINRAVVDSLRFLIPHRHRVFIIHGTGLNKSSGYDASKDTENRLKKAYSPEELDLIADFYVRQDYFHNIGDVYSMSDLMVCRSGAGSLNEISRLGKPAILVPKANLPGDHQVMNARAMKHAGAAEILYEDTIVEEGVVLEKLEGRFLADRIMRLLQDRDRLEQMARCSGTFLRRHAVERILSEMYGDRAYNNGSGFHALPFKPLLTNGQLLSFLSQAQTRNPSNYDPGNLLDDPDDLVYYRHRAAGLLSHNAWQDRNLGVKLIGLTLYDEKIPTLLHMLADRTPVSRFQEFFGGDFQQVGFIRRNVLQALRILNRFDPEVEKHLFIALEDPYFEVRSQACVTASHFGFFLSGQEWWFHALEKRLKDPCFEVVIEAALAIGEMGTDSSALEILLQMRESHYWQVRNAALKGIQRLLQRKIVHPSRELLTEAGSFILTSTDFRPHFAIKETYNNLRKHCLDQLHGERPAQEARLLVERAARKHSS